MEPADFLYLTTRGWKTGRPHEVEIWYVELEGRFYLISERRTHAHWVQNLMRDSQVTFRVAGREHLGSARALESEVDATLERHVQELFQAQYEWSKGLIVELSPNNRAELSGV